MGLGGCGFWHLSSSYFTSLILEYIYIFVNYVNAENMLYQLRSKDQSPNKDDYEDQLDALKPPIFLVLIATMKASLNQECSSS